jgi:hypothetical protein
MSTVEAAAAADTAAGDDLLGDADACIHAGLTGDAIGGLAIRASGASGQRRVVERVGDDERVASGVGREALDFEVVVFIEREGDSFFQG